MKFSALLLLLTSASVATAAPPETQEEKDALGAFVISQMLDVQVSICADGPSDASEALPKLLAKWRLENSSRLKVGEASYIKHAPEMNPTMSGPEYLATLRQAERDKYSGMGTAALAGGCYSLVHWFTDGPGKSQASVPSER